MAASRAAAITDEEAYRDLTLAGTPAGSRAAGMGGAGLALIDDPAGVILNPARLASITHRSGLIGLAARMFDDRSSATGRLRPDRSINPYAGTSVTAGASADEPVGAALLAYAHPFGFRRPIVLGVSRERVLDLSITASTRARTTPLSAPVTPSGGDEVLMVSKGDLDLSMTRYDLGAGWRITPQFSVGGAVVVGMLDLSSRSKGSLADPLQFTVPGMFDPRFSGSAPATLIEVRADGSDTSVAYRFGAWWRAAPGVSLATAFARGNRFSVPGVRRDRLSGSRDPFDDVLKVPDRASLGIAWNPFVRRASARLQSLTIACDLERVQYSDLLDGFASRRTIMTDRRFVRRVRFAAEDATEVRLGAEYEQKFVTWTLVVRGGAYTAHDGRVHLAGASGEPVALEGFGRALEESEAYARDDMEMHATLGAGARFYGFTLDGAIDLSGSGTRAMVSTTFRLGRGR